MVRIPETSIGTEIQVVYVNEMKCNFRKLIIEGEGGGDRRIELYSPYQNSIRFVTD
jgi:hypothetical protein